ncbi:hypothetical protein [Salipiger sp. HF18]|uniref:hypothetical protein n=1 Tax=Salipiger sp. HF18 TaxID=2721557 RepID=UPI00142E696C|nr:hypothetical protein [Salipiger sp. HF18]
MRSREVSGRPAKSEPACHLDMLREATEGITALAELESNPDDPQTMAKAYAGLADVHDMAGATMARLKGLLGVRTEDAARATGPISSAERQLCARWNADRQTVGGCTGALPSAARPRPSSTSRSPAVPARTSHGSVSPLHLGSAAHDARRSAFECPACPDLPSGGTGPHPSIAT